MPKTRKTKPFKRVVKALKKKDAKKTRDRKDKKDSAAVSAPAATAAPVLIRQEDATLPLAQIVVTFNARTEFSESYIAELAESIRQHGILSRLWVRPLERPTKKGETHELIAGECRWRAAQIAGAMVAPVTIFHCTKEQALELGLIENLQRENLSELDEAFGFKKLVDELGYQAHDPEHPEKSITSRVGKSKTYVYARLKLTELPKLGLEAVRNRELSASVGTRIARIPNREAQKEALAEAIKRQWTDADAAEVIARNYMTELKGAPFDRKDETLNAKRGSCEKCPYRSGNQAEMFPDMAAGRADICTDPSCFRLKCERSFERRAAEHKKNGGEVMHPEEAYRIGLSDNHSSVGGEWACLDEPGYFLPGALHGKTPRALLKQLQKEEKCGELITTLALANDGSGKHFEMMKRVDILQILKREGVIKPEQRASGGSNGSYAAAQREQKAAKELDKALVRYQLGLIADRANAASYSIPELLRMVAKWLIRTRGADPLRLIATRRELDVKKFKLESGEQDSASGRFERALLPEAEIAVGQELVALLCELMASPQYISDEGRLSADCGRGAVLDLLGLGSQTLHARALADVPGGEKIIAKYARRNEITELVVAELGRHKKPVEGDDLSDALKLDPEEFRDWQRHGGPDDSRIACPDYWTFTLATVPAEDAGERSRREAAEAELPHESADGSPEDGHDWEKTDLVSGAQTNYKCKRCGVKGVRYGVNWPPRIKGTRKTCVPVAAEAAQI